MWPPLVADDPLDALGVLGIDRQEEAHDHVQQGGRAAPLGTEGAADEQHAQRLASDRDRLAHDHELGGQGDEQGARDDQREVPGPGADPLAEADRNEEVTDGDPPLGGRQAIEARGDDQGRGLQPVTHAVVTTAPSLAGGRRGPTRTGRPGRSRSGWPSGPAGTLPASRSRSRTARPGRSSPRGSSGCRPDRPGRPLRPGRSPG